MPSQDKVNWSPPLSESKENLKNLRVFGSRVWVRPPGIQARRFKDKARKGIFLGYVPHTTCNIIWYDVESERMKIASHCVFDESFNDVPVKRYLLMSSISYGLLITTNALQLIMIRFLILTLISMFILLLRKKLLLPPSLTTTMILLLVSNLVLMNYKIVFMLKKLQPNLVPQISLTTSKSLERD
jgi:hypothetical protein